MKKIIAIAALALSTNLNSFAESAILPDPSDTLEPIYYRPVEKSPNFPGGKEKLMAFISANTKYPEDALKLGIEGLVITRFTVNKDGSICDIEIRRSVDPLLDAEAIRVIKLMPAWEPGEMQGMKVRSKFMLPIAFRLLNKENKKPSEKKKESNPATEDEEEKNVQYVPVEVPPGFKEQR